MLSVQLQQPGRQTKQITGRMKASAQATSQRAQLKFIADKEFMVAPVTPSFLVGGTSHSGVVYTFNFFVKRSHTDMKTVPVSHQVRKCQTTLIYLLA